MALRRLEPWEGCGEEWLSPQEILRSVDPAPERRPPDLYTLLHRLLSEGLLERRDTTWLEEHSERWLHVAMVYRPVQ